MGSLLDPRATCQSFHTRRQQAYPHSGSRGATIHSLLDRSVLLGGAHLGISKHAEHGGPRNIRKGGPTQAEHSGLRSLGVRVPRGTASPDMQNTARRPRNMRTGRGPTHAGHSGLRNMGVGSPGGRSPPSVQDTARGLCGTREVPEHAEHSTKAAQHDQGGAKRRELLDPSVRARPRGGRRTPKQNTARRLRSEGAGL